MEKSNSQESIIRQQRAFILGGFLTIMIATLFSSFLHSSQMEHETSRCNSPHRIEDIPYVSGSQNPRHTLDITMPEAFEPGKETALPVFFFVHGGGWMTFDKRGPENKYADFVGKVTQRGFIGVSINYRLSPEVKHPGHAEDVAAALAWTIENISEYGGNPEKLILGGHSAGAHLVSLIAMDQSYLESLGIKSFQPYGVIPVGGVFNLMDEGFFQAIEEVEYFIETAFTMEEGARTAASPELQIPSSEKLQTRFIIAYGDNDLPYLDEQARNFHEALTEAGFRSELLLLPNRDHYTEIVMAGWEDDLLLPAIQGLLKNENSP